MSGLGGWGGVTKTPGPDVHLLEASWLRGGQPLFLAQGWATSQPTPGICLSGPYALTTSPPPPRLSLARVRVGTGEERTLGPHVRGRGVTDTEPWTSNVATSSLAARKAPEGSTPVLEGSRKGRLGVTQISRALSLFLFGSLRYDSFLFHPAPRVQG